MTEVMFEMVALIFKGVEGLVFNFPAGAAGLDQLNDVLFTHPLVGYPTVVIGDLLVHCEPVLKKIELISIRTTV